jgi:hypothetical protein
VRPPVRAKPRSTLVGDFLELVYTGSAFGPFTGGTEADVLCTIFETLNRTGVKLFEPLTARFWPLKINLLELWE